MVCFFSWNPTACGQRKDLALLSLALGCFLLTGLFASSGLAFEEDKVMAAFVGKSWVNGRSWEKLGYAGKLGFVCGFFDGATVFRAMADQEKGLQKGPVQSIYDSLSVPLEMTVGDVVKGMDEFYADAENLDLPAVCAYIHFIHKSRHGDMAAMDRRVSVWRKMFRP